jgi:hypothetical protein
VRDRSHDFAEAFGEAERASRAHPRTGLEAIANAYEQWLSGDGLRTLLGEITTQFATTPASATGSIPGQIVGETAARPRASIEIEEVVIELTPVSDVAAGAEDLALSAEAIYHRLVTYVRELRQRGGDAAPELLAP